MKLTDKIKLFAFSLYNISQVLKVYKANVIELRESELLQIASKVATDKGIPGHGYTRIYEHFLKDQRSAIKCLCEIGILQHKLQSKDTDMYKITPSLDMWKEYLPEAHIIGFDIKEFINHNENRITTIKGDQKERKDLKKIVDQSSEIDVIIDDALHASEHQQVSLGYLFKYLRPGGLYFIEDLNYQPLDYEKENIPKTKFVLDKFLSTGVWNSPVTTDEEKKVLESHIDTINYFDSLKGSDILIKKDAIAVIVKKKKYGSRL